MKTKFLTALLLGFLAMMPVSIPAAEARLNLYIWSEYIDPQIIKEFEQANQCKVVIDLYEEAEAMMAKLQGAGSGLYDVVVPPDYLVPAMAKLGILAPLNRQRIPNLKNLDPAFANPPFDPGNKYSAAYQWGTLGIFIRSKGKVADTWGLIFDPKLQTGPFVMMDSMRDTIGAALKYKTLSLNSTNPEELKQARDLILQAKKRAVAFDNSVGGKNRVLSKEVAAAVVYSGEAVRAMSEDKETQYIIPREGSQIWVDNMVLLAKGPNPVLGARFINYILDPKVGAALSRYTKFATPNAEAKKLLEPEITGNLAIYPTPETMQKLEFLKDLGGKSRIYDEVWTQIKTR